MAKVSFGSDIKVKAQRQTFPKISGLKKGEKIRIQLMDTSDITMEYVHNLEAPIVEGGKGVMDDKGNFKKSYKGSPLSFGDISILEERGLDVKNCPISKMAKEHPDWVSAPRRKFAMHVIQYKTKPGSFDVATPFSVEHKVWVFTDKTFVKLRDYINEWEDLRKHDLYITCENEQFQQYDITVAPKAAWLNGDKADAQLTQATYEAGKAEYEDISQAIGTRKELEWVKRDLEEIEEAWRIVSGAGAQNNLHSAAEGMSDFLPNSSPSKQDDPDEDILANLADGSEDSDGEDATDFDDLLAGLTK